MTPKPRMASSTLLRCERARKPITHMSAPMYMALRAVEITAARSQPAGKAMPAWKKTQTLNIQKVLLCPSRGRGTGCPRPSRTRIRRR